MIPILKLNERGKKQEASVNYDKVEQRLLHHSSGLHKPKHIELYIQSQNFIYGNCLDFSE